MYSFTYTRIQKVTLPPSIITIVANIFEKCNVEVLDMQLTKIKYLPGGLIRESFKITHIYLPSTISQFGEIDFLNLRNCKIFVNSEIKTMVNNAFYGATNITLVYCGIYQPLNCPNLTSVFKKVYVSKRFIGDTFGLFPVTKSASICYNVGVTCEVNNDVYIYNHISGSVFIFFELV